MNRKRYEIATRKLLSMQEAIEKGDRAAFLKLMEGYTLGNCSRGDEFLQEKIISVYQDALNKWI